MKVVFDAFGGDNAPDEVVKGAALAEKELDISVVLTGDREKIEDSVKRNHLTFKNLEIVDASDVMPMEEHPTTLLKAHRDSSMAVAFRLLAEDKADAFVSAGSTGAIVVGGTLIVKRIKGVKRPALGSLLPAPGGSYFLMDMGANADCRPEMLCQFGTMASILLEKVYGRKNPRIGLLNIGTEATKGGELQLAAYELMCKAPYNFIGNIESREMPKGVCDAVITDGFSGNIALKLIEGTSITLFHLIKGMLYQNIFTKFAALILKNGLYQLKNALDSSEVGGAVLLGVRKPVIKAHGNSDAVAIKNAVIQAKKYVESGAIATMTEALSAVGENKNEEA